PCDRHALTSSRGPALCARMLRIPILPIVLFGASAFAEAPFTFDSTPGRLPKDVRPMHYEIRVEPDVDKAVFNGKVTIDVEARKAVGEITLNSLGLKITSAKIDGNDAVAKADDTTQLLTLSGTDLQVGKHTVALEFSGKLSERPQGLFLT